MSYFLNIKHLQSNWKPSKSNPGGTGGMTIVTCPSVRLNPEASSSGSSLNVK